MTSEYNLKNFDDTDMPAEAVIAYAKFGYACYQIFQQENLLHLILGDHKMQSSISETEVQEEMIP